jgi:activating signal cointegrator complex subunit 2
MKADILRRVEELSDDGEESDGEGYDEDDVVKVKLGGDGEESDEEGGDGPETRDVETILELAYIAGPKQFDRDAQTRRSHAREKLKAQTGKKFLNPIICFTQFCFSQAGLMNRLKGGG